MGSILGRFTLVGAIVIGMVGNGAEARVRHHHARHYLTRTSSAPLGGDYYTNVNGHSVHRPARADSRPSGATAKCRDSSWSFSESHRGTCSHHGGVQQWL